MTRDACSPSAGTVSGAVGTPSSHASRCRAPTRCWPRARPCRQTSTARSSPLTSTRTSLRWRPCASCSTSATTTSRAIPGTAWSAVEASSRTTSTRPLTSCATLPSTAPASRTVPTSNSALGSGLFPLREHVEHGVRVALGSDVGAGTGFSLFKEGLQAYFTLHRASQTGGCPSPRRTCSTWRPRRGQQHWVCPIGSGRSRPAMSSMRFGCGPSRAARWLSGSGTLRDRKRPWRGPSHSARAPTSRASSWGVNRSRLPA